MKNIFTEKVELLFLKINGNRHFKILTVCIITVVLMCFCHQSIRAQVNYVRTWTATAPETNPNKLITRPLSDAKQVTQFIDGLGRPIQTVAKLGSLETSSGNNTDLVSMLSYDGFGRNNINYLPYTASSADGSYKTDAFTAQPAFYNGTSPIAGQGEIGANAHAQINFESSPLNRPSLNMAPGNSWVGNGTGVGIQSGYWINTTADDVRMWSVTNSGTAGVFGSYTMTGAYPAGTLYKKITTDENSNQIIEFKDMDGKVILKKVQPASGTTDNGSGSGYGNWLCTYFIYDDLGNLRCVVQPAGVQTLTGNGRSMTATSTLLGEQCFRYEYDQRNRMIMKQVPGAAGAVYIVYDNIDRLVMTQDANLRNLAMPQWIVTVYDNLNRPIQTGLLNGSSGDFSSNLNAAYSSTSYPSTASGFELLTVTHYDDYTVMPTNSPTGLTSTLQTTWNNQFSAASTTTFPYPVTPVQSTTTVTAKGLVTWSQLKVINSGSPGTYLSSVNIYDDKARVIQTQSQNYSQGINVTTTQYSWTGQPLVVVQSQQKGGTNSQTTVTVSRMSYDNLNRLVNTSKQVQNTLVNNNTIQTNSVTALQYDVLGQLSTKNLGATPNPLETQIFEYNIRGWLLGVNRAFVRNTATADGANNSGESFTTPLDYSAGHLFGFELGYDKSPTVGGASWTSPIQYNGNITGTIWKSEHDGQIRKYDFSYDAANRLTAANFTQYNNASGNTGFNIGAGVDFSMNIPDYDANGNIKHMNQNGLQSASATSSGPIDQLTYTYIPGTNKLQSVTDGANSLTPAPGASGYLGDFHYASGAGSGAIYTYDGNGNLTSDGNKNISSIAYNYLNLPQTITASRGSINYVYDAAGNKLQKQIIEGSTVTTTLYMGGIVYQNDVLQFITHEEGRIRVNSSNNGYIFDYFLKDHLGNTRMTITDDNSVSNHIIDATSYYPFGLRMDGISTPPAAGNLINRFKFNGGNELQNQEFSDKSGIEMYDAVHRMYDPQLGIFHQIDEFADMSLRGSPYAFASNNPILRNDPLGLEDTLHGSGSVSVEGVRHLSQYAMEALYWRLRDAGNGFGGASSSALRTRLERWDRVERFMEGVRAEQKEEELDMLAYGSWLIPGGEIAELAVTEGLANAALELLKIKSGKAMLVSAGADLSIQMINNKGTLQERLTRINLLQTAANSVLKHPLMASTPGAMFNISLEHLKSGTIVQLSDPNLCKSIILSRCASIGGEGFIRETVYGSAAGRIDQFINLDSKQSNK